MEMPSILTLSKAKGHAEHLLHLPTASDGTDTSSAFRGHFLLFGEVNAFYPVPLVCASGETLVHPRDRGMLAWVHSCAQSRDSNFRTHFLTLQKKYLIPLLCIDHRCICIMLILILKIISLIFGQQLYLFACAVFSFYYYLFLTANIFCDLTSNYNSIQFPGWGNTCYLII